MMLEPRYVDTREAAVRLQPLQVAGFIPKALQYGDVAFPEAGGSTVLLEHKHLSQALTDWKSGQLARQVRGMCEQSPYAMLLVEGPLTLDQHGRVLGSGVAWDAFANYLLSLQNMGLRWELVPAGLVVLRVLSIAHYYAEGFHISAARQPAGNPQAAVLAMVAGIGQTKAKALLAEMGSLACVVEAPIERLAEVEGIGPVLAQRLHQFWRAVPTNHGPTQLE